MLDSDNIPVIDPVELFSSNMYRRYGSVFWPDLTRTRPGNQAWRITNMPCRRDEYEFETGQLMVDKSKLWYHLQLAAWLRTQPYWKTIVLGDKELFRFAWHALKTDFGRPVKWITSIGFVAEQRAHSEDDKLEDRVVMDYCGHTFAQHRPDHSTKAGDAGSGIAFLHGGFLKTLGAPFLARLRARSGGLFAYYKSLDTEKSEDWSQIEYGVVSTVWNVGWYLNHTSKLEPHPLVSADEDLDLDGRFMGDTGLQRLELTDKDRHAVACCIDFAGVKPWPLSNFGWEELGYEILFSHAGGYWMIEEGYRW